ncbi:glycoprotein precursor complex [Adana virus]|uniref:Envelopment polyprotein n=1 Tax=Adana virus TaxID=1611877 RepID=A0A0C5ARY4_9VIRU|nr:glycoprotein precursor complex [Adana virus]AJK91619.1 glycoprotein precursor complex [Adana virus]
MYQLIVLILQRIVLAESKVSLTITSPDYSSLSCFNSAVSAKFVQRKWATEVSKMGDFDQFCYYNNDIPKRSTGENSQGIMTFVVLSDVPYTFSCVSEDRSKLAIVHNDGVPSDGEPAYIDCEKGSMIHLLSSSDPDVPKSNPALEEEHELLKERFDDLQLKFNDNVRRLEAENQDLKVRLDQLHSSRESLKLQKSEQEGNLTQLNAIIHDLTKKVRDGENAVLNLLSEARRDKEALIQLEEDTDRRLEENDRLIASLKARAHNIIRAPTTVKPLITTAIAVTLLSSALLVAADREHIDNRPGNGKYHSKQNTYDDNCNLILYNSKCGGWNLQKNQTKYPFFNSHYHKYSLVEAMHNTILALSNKGVCKILNDSAQRYTECVKDLMPMELECPEGYRYGYYLNNKGTISGIECDTRYQLSRDCKMCIKTTSEVKGVLPLQDVFCQTGAINYSGPVMTLRGVCSIGTKRFRECSQVSSSIEKVPFITFDKHQKLYLDSLVMRNVETKSPDNFLCFERKGQFGAQDQHHTEHATMRRIDPKECKSVTENKQRSCTGDIAFCSAYTCYREYPDTTCEVAPGSGPVEVFYGGVWTRPSCIGYENTMVTREAVKTLTPRETPCTACVWSCEKEGIKVTSHGFKMFSAVACAKGSCISTHQEGSTEILIPYPGLTKMSGGKIGIHISHDDQSVSAHLIVRCKPKPACEVDECTFCFHGLINYQCHTAVSSLIVTTIVVGLIIMIMAIITKMLKIMKLLPSFTRKPVVWVSLLAKWLVRVCRRVFTARIEGINNAIGWNQDVERPPEVAVRERGRARPVQYYLYANAILCLLTTPALCCTENVVASSKISKCVNQGVKTTCRLSGVVTLRAGSIGSEACLTIKGPSDDQVEFLTIRTVSSDLVCHEGDSFWTNHFTPKCLSSRRCHLVSECTGDNCQKWDNRTVSKEFEHMTDNSLMTENVCFEQCGAAGCGCFNVNPSCLFGHTYLMPTRSEAVKIFECVSWTHRIVLEVSGPNINTREIVLSALSTQIAEWGSITLNLDAEVMNLGNPITFMRTSSGAMAIVDEPFSRSPRKGFIGEVRCSSEAHAARGDSSCLRAPDLIKYKPQLDMLGCTSSLIDPYAILLRSSLPQKRGNHVFTTTKDGHSVQAMTSGSVNAEFSILLDSYEVEFKSDQTSCDAAFVNITGCYSCNEGAEVCVKVVTTGAGSFFAISDESNQAIQFKVQTGETSRCKILHFNKPEVEESFTYSCGGDRKPMIVRGTLIAVGPHDDRVAGGTSVVVNPRASSWSASGWFSGFISWLGGPLRAFGMIVLYITIAVIIIIIIVLLIRALMIRAAIARAKMQ